MNGKRYSFEEIEKIRGESSKYVTKEYAKNYIVDLWEQCSVESKFLESNECGHADKLDLASINFDELEKKALNEFSNPNLMMFIACVFSKIKDRIFGGDTNFIKYFKNIKVLSDKTAYGVVLTEDFGYNEKDNGKVKLA